MKKIFMMAALLLLTVACQDLKNRLSVSLPSHSNEGWFTLILCDQMIDINRDHVGFIDTNQLAPHFEIQLLQDGLPYPNPITFSTVDGQFTGNGKTYRHISFYLGERKNESPEEEAFSDKDWFRSKRIRFLSESQEKGLLECPSAR